MKSEIIFNKILKEGLSNFKSSSGREPNDGNGRVGGAYGSASATAKDEEIEIEVTLDNEEYFLVGLLVNVDLNYEYDDSVGYGPNYSVEFDEGEIGLKYVYSEDSQEEVTDEELKKTLFEKAKEEFVANPDEYTSYLWDDFGDDSDDYEPDYEPDFD